MIDLEAWERTQLGANRYAGEIALWKLSQRYGWGIPHPTIKVVMKVRDDVSAQMRQLQQAIAKLAPQIRTISEATTRSAGNVR